MFACYQLECIRAMNLGLETVLLNYFLLIGELLNDSTSDLVNKTFLMPREREKSVCVIYSLRSTCRKSVFLGGRYRWWYKQCKLQSIEVPRVMVKYFSAENFLADDDMPR